MSQSLQPMGQGPAPVEYTPADRDPWASSDYGIPDEPTGISWRRRLTALRRYKFLILACVAAGAVGAYVAHESVTPVYRVQGQVWVTEGANEDEEGPIRQADLLQTDAYLNLLSSFPVLEPVVRKHRLFVSFPSEFEEVFTDFDIVEEAISGRFILQSSEDGRSLSLFLGDEREPVETAVAGSPMGKDLGFHWIPTNVPASAEIAFSVRTVRQAASSLQGQLDQNMNRTGSWVNIRLEGTNPKVLSPILTTILEEYEREATDLKKDRLSQRNAILKAQLDTVTAKREAADVALRVFRTNTITEPDDTPTLRPGMPSTESTIMNDYFSRQLEAEGLRSEIERIEAALEMGVDDPGFVWALESIPSIGSSSQMTEVFGRIAVMESSREDLLEIYTEEWEEVVDVTERLNEAKRVEVPAIAETIIVGLQNRVQVLEREQVEREVELRKIPQRMLQEGRLQAEANRWNNLYGELGRRFTTAVLAESTTFADVRILSWPREPRVPFSDGRQQWMMIILLSSLGVGVLGALVLDQLDSRLRYATDVSDDLGLRILGVVPRIQGGRKGNAGQVREAFRDLRLHVEYAYGAAAPLMVAVTSPNESEGKTTISANLAMAFASLGRRTLVIDGDTRRGNLHALLGCERKPGLTEFLQGSGSGDVIQETDHENLWMISSGSRRANSPELLGSQRMLALASAIKRRYEVIIIDCPPLQAGSDAFVLGAHAGNVLLVLRSGASRKDVAAAKLEGFLRLPVRILGAALNDAKAGLNFSEYAYYSDYLPGYEAVDEEGAEEDLVLTLPKG